MSDESVGMFRLICDEFDNIGSYDIEDVSNDQDDDVLKEIAENFFNVEENGDHEANNRGFRTVDPDEFLLQNQNKNTKRKTDSDMRLFLSFLLSKNEPRKPEFIPPDVLNTLLCEFILGVTKKDGTEYEPTTLRGFIGSIDRHLKAVGSRMSIFRDIEFNKSRSILTKKMQQLKSVGLGNKPREAQVLDTLTINKLYDAKTLGGYSPRALIDSMWFICTQYFGMRTGKECRDLCWGDVQLCIDESSGAEYLMLDKERQTKTRTGANPRDTRKGKPKAWATNVDQKCPVTLYKLYKEKRPSDLSTPDSPFFLTPGNTYQCWFKKTPIGINKMYNIMNEMKADAGIEAPRITPYSSRKRLLTRLCDEDIPVNQIIQVSGHKNVNSVNNYSRMNDEQSKKISDILSDTTGNKSITNLDLQVRTDGAASSSQRQSGMGLFSHGLFANSHFHGPVTFHFSSTSVSENQTLSQMSAVSYNNLSTNHVVSPVIRPAYKRIRMIESDDINFTYFFLRYYVCAKFTV